MFTLVRMNWNSCPMLAPTPSADQEEAGDEVPARGGARTGEDQREHGRPGGDEHDSDVEQVTSESADDRGGTDHAEDHPHHHRRQRQAGVDR